VAPGHRRARCRPIGLEPTDLLPIVVGQVSLALALSAYTVWLDSKSADLDALLDQAMTGLRDYLTS